MDRQRAIVVVAALAALGGLGWLLARQADSAAQAASDKAAAAHGQSAYPAVDDSHAVSSAQGASPAEMDNVVHGNNQFALELYRQLGATPGNVFCSPYSISTALAMTAEGARGQTADEIAAVFHLPSDAAARRSAFTALLAELNGGSQDYQLSVANALWTQQGYPFLPEFLHIVEQSYGGAARNLDFRHDAEAARLRINGWVEDHTQDKIKDLFARGTLDENTRLVLTNAVYFKGQWRTQFDATQTADAPFTLAGGAQQPVPLMRQTGEAAKFGYAENAQAQALELPYNGDKLALLVLLPRTTDGLPVLEQSLTPETLAAWRQQLSTQRVNVYLPKFKLATKYELNPMLAALGMPGAFEPGADFSGLDGTKELYLQLVVHQANVDVNEEGTEAAAATGVAVRTLSAINPGSIPTFRADHPFLFAIVERQHGGVLFLGRQAAPQA